MLSIHAELCIMHCELCIILYELCIIICALCIILYELYVKNVLTNTISAYKNKKNRKKCVISLQIKFKYLPLHQIVEFYSLIH